jgi:hypothetical protein
MEKKKIEIKFAAWANYTEFYPMFYLRDEDHRDHTAFEVEISLTEHQVKDYRETMRKFFEWQQIIRDLAFCDMGLCPDLRED